MNPENFDSRRESHRASNRSSHQRSHSNPENEYAFRMQTISRENHINPRNPLPLYQLLADNNEEYKETNHQMRQADGERDNRGELDIRGLNEEFNNLQLRRSMRNPTANFPRDNQMRGFLQYYQQEFPLDFGKLQENMQHEAQQSDARNCLETIYKMRKVPKPVARNVLPYEPFMKLTVLRTSFEKHLVMEYYVTPRGMVNTNRNTDHDDIMIGRQQATPEGVIPNDICLFYSDRAISRVHAKIITKYGFNIPREIPSNFVAFLMMSHKRLGVQSVGYKIPEGIYRHIFSFIKEPKKFWLVDLGSSFGTYIKLTPGLHALEKGQTYLVGLDTYFNIVDVKNSIQREGGQPSDCEGERSTREQEEFMKFLFQERVYNKCEIHGLSDLEEEMLEFKISSHKDLLYEEDNNFLETERCLPSFKRPYLKIEVHNYGGFHSTPNHILIGNPQNEFTVGRMQECDVNLTQNTAISRKQCRFAYHEGIWYIADGIASKKSANGTWVSLTDYRLKRERVESEPREIENGSEIKINDTVLQVEVFNNS